MIRFLYNLLFPIGLLFILPGYLLKMRRRGNYRRNFGQRFGFYTREVRTRLATQSSTWIHAVSVGEVAIALKLATKLRALDAGFSCVLTTTTTTGFAFGTAEAPAWMAVMYNPLDFWAVVRRAFRVIRPERIILVEAEVWPNLVAEGRARRVPIALVNARLSARSERRFLKFGALVRPVFGCLDLVCVQEAKDVARWNGLGVARSRIEEVGSIKYDPSESSVDVLLPQRILGSYCIDEARPVLFGGSTHPGEEEALATAFLQLRAEFSDLVLAIAPRHVERSPQILTALELLGLRTALRSTGDTVATAEPDCLLLDTTGELRSWYGIATVVFIGKSLATHGGQNPVEPILAGKPVIFGPHMENFASLAASLLQHDGALQIEGSDDLIANIADLLRDAPRRTQLVANALKVLAPHRDATQRTAELLLNLRSHAAASQ